MSPETNVTPFRPAALTVPTGERTVDERGERARAAGYAAGWVAGARAAAESASEQARRLAEQAAAGQARRDADLAAALATLGRAAAAASATTAPVLDEARGSLHVAALDLAAAVLQHELSSTPGSAVALLGRALALPVDVGVHTVRLNPADLTSVHQALDAGEAQLPDGVRLVADPRIDRGGAVSEYPDGYLDARVSTALERARTALLEEQG